VWPRPSFRLAFGDFIADKFRRDESGDVCAKALTRGHFVFCAFKHFLTAEIFPLGDIDHFFRNDARFREFILGYHFTVETT